MLPPARPSEDKTKVGDEKAKSGDAEPKPTKVYKFHCIDARGKKCQFVDPGVEERPFTPSVVLETYGEDSIIIGMLLVADSEFTDIATDEEGPDMYDVHGLCKEYFWAFGKERGQKNLEEDKGWIHLELTAHNAPVEGKTRSIFLKDGTVCEFYGYDPERPGAKQVQKWKDYFNWRLEEKQKNEINDKFTQAWEDADGDLPTLSKNLGWT